MSQLGSARLPNPAKCRREDSNLGRTYAGGPEPRPVDRLGTATRKGEDRESIASTVLACRHEDSNLGRIYTNGPQPSPFGHLGMAAQYRGQDSNLRKPT